MTEIPEFSLELVPLDETAQEARRFQYAGPEIGHRSKVGGKPDFIQRGTTPRCRCGDEMTFYAQIDSVGDDLMLADCGMLYVFVCFGCFEATAFIESY